MNILWKPKSLWKPSPFFKDRGADPIDMVVIHHIGSDKGKLYGMAGTIVWFTDPEAHTNKETGKLENVVSAHYAIPREPYEGYDIVQFVNDIDVAYHAGDSQWTVDGKVRRYLNKYSIGIELEGDGNLVKYTDFQYQVLGYLVKLLVDGHHIKQENVVGHQDIAPKRKVDPGSQFDWDRLRRDVFAPAAPVVTPAVPPPVTPTVTAPVVTTPVEIHPPEVFHMGGGEDHVGKSKNFLNILIELIMSLFGNK